MSNKVFKTINELIDDAMLSIALGIGIYVVCAYGYTIGSIVGMWIVSWN